MIVGDCLLNFLNWYYMCWGILAKIIHAHPTFGIYADAKLEYGLAVKNKIYLWLRLPKVQSDYLLSSKTIDEGTKLPTICRM